MNILFLAPRLPWPADTGGKIRTVNILKQLLKFAAVHLVCFSFEAKDEEWKKEIEQMGARVTLVPIKETPLFKKIRNVVFEKQPHSIVKYYAPSMKNILKTVIRSEHFDAVHIDHLHMAHYIEIFKERPCFLDEHNVEYKILERCVAVEPSLLKKTLFSSQSRKMKKFETQRLRQCTRYFTVSEDDKEILKRLAGDSVVVGHVIPNGVDTDYFQSSKTAPTEEALVFTGSMDWLPNTDAVIYFSNEILPLVWKVRPQIKFYIIGKSPSNSIKELAQKDPRIILTGRVDDVRPLMAKSKVFVVPIRVGGGTRLKILEAMAMKQGIVSTTIGAEGIRHTDGTNILLADSPQEFADKVLTLLNDPALCASMAESGRQLVCRLYDWNVIGLDLKTIYKEVVHA